MEVSEKTKYYLIYEHKWEDFWIIWNDDIDDILIWYRVDNEKRKKLYKIYKGCHTLSDGLDQSLDRIQVLNEKDKGIVKDFIDKVKDHKKNGTLHFKRNPGKWQAFA